MVSSTKQSILTASVGITQAKHIQTSLDLPTVFICNIPLGVSFVVNLRRSGSQRDQYTRISLDSGQGFRRGQKKQRHPPLFVLVCQSKKSPHQHIITLFSKKSTTSFSTPPAPTAATPPTKSLNMSPKLSSVQGTKDERTFDSHREGRGAEVGRGGCMFAGRRKKTTVTRRRTSSNKTSQARNTRRSTRPLAPQYAATNSTTAKRQLRQLRPATLLRKADEGVFKTKTVGYTSNIYIYFFRQGREETHFGSRSKAQSPQLAGHSNSPKAAFRDAGSPRLTDLIGGGILLPPAPRGLLSGGIIRRASPGRAATSRSASAARPPTSEGRRKPALHVVPLFLFLVGEHFVGLHDLIKPDRGRGGGGGGVILTTIRPSFSVNGGPTRSYLQYILSNATVAWLCISP